MTNSVTPGIPPAHPLHGSRRPVPVVLIILIGLLSLRWPAEQVVALVLVLTPATGSAAERQA